MTDFTITEDFPKNKIEFDERFSNPTNCYDYLFKQKWPNGFICKKCGNSNYWLQKLRRCTIRQDREKLSRRVEVDEFFVFIPHCSEFESMWNFL